MKMHLLTIILIVGIAGLSKGKGRVKVRKVLVHKVKNCHYASKPNFRYIFKKHKGSVVPVIYVPGDGGSIIEAKTENFTTPQEAACRENEDWHRIWLRIAHLHPYNLRCQAEKLKLHFDPKNKKSRDPDGLTTRIVGYGKSEGFEYLDNSWSAYALGNAGKHGILIVKALLERGYKRDISIRSAPYDFRYSLSSNEQYLKNLQLLIEDTYMINNNTRVAILCHSMGGLYGATLLNRMTTEWKNKYIDSFIPLSVPWGGSISALEAILSGYDFQTGVLNKQAVRVAQRTFESNFYLLPNPRIMEPGEVVVNAPHRTYTASPQDMMDLFRDIGIGTELYEKVLKSNQETIDGGFPTKSPGVETFCIFGSGLKTPVSVDFEREEDFPDNNSVFEYEPGDETVSLRSMSVCAHWPDTVSVLDIGALNHMSTLFETRSIKEIVRVLFRNHPNSHKFK